MAQRHCSPPRVVNRSKRIWLICNILSLGMLASLHCRLSRQPFVFDYTHQHLRNSCWMYEWINVFAWQKLNTISQTGTPRRNNCVRLLVSLVTIIQIRVTIIHVKTSITNKNYLVIKPTKTLNVRKPTNYNSCQSYIWSSLFTVYLLLTFELCLGRCCLANSIGQKTCFASSAVTNLYNVY